MLGVMFYNGDAVLAPGLTVHAVGGHSAGLQFVRVKTSQGFVALPSDVSHFYQKMASSRPFTGAFHMGEMLEDFDRLLDLAHDESHIVSDHDPLVVKLYSAPSPELKGVAVRLDVPPSGVAPKRADYPSHD
jgi:glyoxylase-like metal-dependent hydrolase (beta-lactamase superfamily II)